jgi:putative thioredoxin
VATPGHEVVALEHPITAVEREKHYMEQLPRRACVALFNLLGGEHPLSQHWRRRFHMALY